MQVAHPGPARGASLRCGHSTRYPGNLPVQLTAFVGRADDLAEVARGTGRRSLSSRSPASAASARPGSPCRSRPTRVRRFPDGAWFVDLGPVAERRVRRGDDQTSLALPGAPARHDRGVRSSPRSATSTCSWCSTTASTSSNRSPSWSTASSDSCPGVRCSPRAARRSRSTARRPTRCGPGTAAWRDGDHRRHAARERRRAAVRRSGTAAKRGLHADGRQRSRHRRASAGVSTAFPLAIELAAARLKLMIAGRGADPSRRAVPAPHRRPAHGAGASSDAARRDRLVVRAARPGRAAALRRDSACSPVASRSRRAEHVATDDDLVLPASVLTLLAEPRREVDGRHRRHRCRNALPASRDAARVRVGTPRGGRRSRTTASKSCRSRPAARRVLGLAAQGSRRPDRNSRPVRRTGQPARGARVVARSRHRHLCEARALHGDVLAAGRQLPRDEPVDACGHGPRVHRLAWLPRRAARVRRCRRQLHGPLRGRHQLVRAEHSLLRGGRSHARADRGREPRDRRARVESFGRGSAPMCGGGRGGAG